MKVVCFEESERKYTSIFYSNPAERILLPHYIFMHMTFDLYVKVNGGNSGRGVTPDITILLRVEES